MSRRISKIVTGLLYFSRDGHKDPMKLTPVEQIVNDSLSLTKAKIKWHRIDLQLEISEGVGNINCRPWEVSQILINLINNSIEVLESQEVKSLKISARNEQKFVRLEILDSGPGIPESEHEKIFEPFYTTKEVGKGVGLGLSISKGIAEDHKGRLTLAKSDLGAKFIIELPSEVL